MLRLFTTATGLADRHTMKDMTEICPDENARIPKLARSSRRLRRLPYAVSPPFLVADVRPDAAAAGEVGPTGGTIARSTFLVARHILVRRLQPDCLVTGDVPE